MKKATTRVEFNDIKQAQSNNDPKGATFNLVSSRRGAAEAVLCSIENTPRITKGPTKYSKNKSSNCFKDKIHTMLTGHIDKYIFAG